MSVRIVASIALLGILAVTAHVQAVQPKNRSLITAEFKEIDDRGYPIVKITNMTGKEIDTVRGAFIMEDLEGKQLFGTGQTDAVPGLVFLAVGETKEFVPFGLNRKPELMERLRTSPLSVRFFFEVRGMTYMDGTEEYLPQ